MQLVHMNDIAVGMVVAQDVPAPKGSIPLVRKGAVVDREVLRRMRLHDVHFAFISSAQPPARRSEAPDAPSRIHMPTIKPVISDALRAEGVSSLEDLFEQASIGLSDVHGSTTSVIKNITNVVDRLVESLDGQSVVSVLNLKSHDDYTYHHSMSVAALTIAIGQQMGFNKETLQRLGKCAMLHDIGKISIPTELINKPSRLLPEEFATMKGHSTAGHGYLTQTFGDEDLLQGVVQHHERVDGSGYPYGAKKENIHPWSKIISVADVYDALTSNRSYRTASSPGDAIEFLMGGVGKDFDFDVVECFLQKVEIYPIGSKVQLSTGQLAVVYNSENKLRPVVRVLSTGDILDLYRDKNCRSVIITNILDLNS
ncbi:MAG: HD-GYP domain-containing protein [Oscillospiraceae bacterium]|nr:HD-GYP domain-containing protein [Oscillospiraceae bacterium]